MATHSSSFAWRIPWREEPDELQSMGSQRVGHNWATNTHTHTHTHTHTPTRHEQVLLLSRFAWGSSALYVTCLIILIQSYCIWTWCRSCWKWNNVLGKHTHTHTLTWLCHGHTHIHIRVLTSLCTGIRDEESRSLCMRRTLAGYIVLQFISW